MESGAARVTGKVRGRLSEPSERLGEDMVKLWMVARGRLLSVACVCGGWRRLAGYWKAFAFGRAGM